MRRLGTGLFLLRPELYKARGFSARPIPQALRMRDSIAAQSTLFYDGTEPNQMLALSVVVPVKDEAENVAPLAREIARAVAGEGQSEIIFVDDGSTDSTASVLNALKIEIPSLRVVQHARNMGQSRAIRTGVRFARAEIVATLDGDGQNDPADLPKLLDALRRGHGDNVGLVSGVRVHRQDVFQKRFASGFANGFRRWMLKDGAIDAGCGLKVFRRDAFLALPYFDHMHRFLIALMLRERYQVRFVEVNHRSRAHGRSKYNNLNRALIGFVDTFGVRWLQKRFRGLSGAKEL